MIQNPSVQNLEGVASGLSTLLLSPRKRDTLKQKKMKCGADTLENSEEKKQHNPSGTETQAGPHRKC